jgi:hypothetical protein
VSDETEATNPVNDNAKPASPRPSPTSRARRIGGRPTPRPTPSGATAPVAADASRDSDPPPPVAMTKAAREEPTRRAPAPPGRGLPMTWIPAGVLGLGVLVLLVILVVVSHGVYWAKPDDSAGARMARQEQVLAAAKKCFAQINSYDYRKLDGVLAKDLACTTGTFTNDLRKTLSTQIIPLAPKLKATQTAQVNKAGVTSVSRSGNQVGTVIYGQLAQTNSTTARKSPRIDVVGAVVTMDKVGDLWLVSKIDTDVGNSLGS